MDRARALDAHPRLIRLVGRKDAVHVAEAAVYHQWIIRLTIGQKVSSRRPAIERKELITTMTPKQAVALIRERTGEGAALVSGLSD